jgi:hypothetical protein
VFAQGLGLESEVDERLTTVGQDLAKAYQEADHITAGRVPADSGSERISCVHHFITGECLPPSSPRPNGLINECLQVSAVTTEFAHLKMLAHVFVVADAPDLAQIVRDVSRYGGAYRPEDIYEFVQRRADWKAIERTVDKAMYNLSFKEDCVVA